MICKFYFVLDSITIFISEQDARHAYICKYAYLDLAMNFDLHNKFGYLCRLRTVRTQKAINIEDNRYKCINAVYIGSKGQVLLMNVQTLMFRQS